MPLTRIVLVKHADRAPKSEEMADKTRSRERHIRLHRDLLQPTATPFSAAVSLSSRARVTLHTDTHISLIFTLKQVTTRGAGLSVNQTEGSPHRPRTNLTSIEPSDSRPEFLGLHSWDSRSWGYERSCQYIGCSPETHWLLAGNRSRAIPHQHRLSNYVVVSSPWAPTICIWAGLTRRCSTRSTGCAACVRWRGTRWRRPY